jgi:hypothetical protein
MVTILATDKGHAMTTEIKSRWTVWVGGVEVNDYEIETREKAEELAEFWRHIQGHDDVQIEELNP